MPLPTKAEILLVEDNPGDVALMRASLAKWQTPRTLHVARSGHEALSLLGKTEGHSQSVCPDLILLDLNMPGIDGREVLRRVKEDEELRAIPVIILTSSRAKANVRCSYNLHANCYITKPVQLSDFADVMKSLEVFWLRQATLPRR